MKYIFILLLFTSCAYQDPYFQPYTQKVIDYCIEYDCGIENHIAMISIKFGDLEKADGYCGLNGIVIDRTRWENKQEVDREVLILHEYGHCAFNRDDINEIDYSIGYPTSLMYHETWRTANFYRFDEYKEMYLEELFR